MSPTTAIIFDEDVRQDGAVGDGVTDDTTAIDDAIARVANPYLPAGGVFRYVGTIANDTIFAGPGKILMEEPGFEPSFWGGSLLAGTSGSRIGAQRVERNGGLYLDEMQLAPGFSSGSMFVYAPPQASLLYTLQGDSYDFAGSVDAAVDDNRVVRTSGTVNGNHIGLDMLIHWGAGKYRVSAVGSNFIDLVNDDAGRTPVSLPSLTDIVRVPAHRWFRTADVTGTTMTITGGGWTPEFGPSDYNGDRVFVMISGTWYSVTANGTNNGEYTLGSSPGTLTGASVQLVLQPSYTAQWTMQGNKGGGLENRIKVRRVHDAYEVFSNGSGVTEEVPVSIGVNNTRSLNVNEDSVDVVNDLNVGGRVEVTDRLRVSGNTLLNFTRPEALGFDFGNTNFHFNRGYFGRIFSLSMSTNFPSIDGELWQDQGIVKVHPDAVKRGSFKAEGLPTGSAVEDTQTVVDYQTVSAALTGVSYSSGIATIGSELDQKMVDVRATFNLEQQNRTYIQLILQFRTGSSASWEDLDVFSGYTSRNAIIPNGSVVVSDWDVAVATGNQFRVVYTASDEGSSAPDYSSVTKAARFMISVR